MKIVDSVGWVAYFMGGPLADAYEEHLMDPEEVMTPSIVFYEVYKHVLRARGEDLAAAAGALMERTEIVDLDPGLALSAAELSLERRLPMADAIIYATAQAYEVPLVTSDAHFEGLPGVEYIPRATGDPR